MISAFGVDHGEISKAQWTPEQKKVVRDNRRRSTVVNTTALGATGGAAAASLGYTQSMMRHTKKARHAWNNGDLNGWAIHDGKRLTALKNGSRVGVASLGVAALGSAAMIGNDAYSRHKRKKAFGG